MSRRRGYGRDLGLTIRMFVTMSLLGLVYLFFIGVLLWAGVGIIFVAILAALMLGFQYFFSDRLVLASMRAKIVSPQEMPQLHGLIERLAAMTGLPKPRVALADTDVPNAFATGRSPGKSVVCVTSGLLRRLSDSELEAVLAHELAHVQHRDVMVMTLAGFFATLAGMLTQILAWSALFGGIGGGFGGGRDRGGGFAVMMVVFLVSILVHVVSQILLLTLSRYREYAADRGGAVTTGAPANLASALMKISGSMARIPQNDLRKVEGASAFFIVPALSRDAVARLFATHPPVEERVARLRRMQQEMERPR